MRHLLILCLSLLCLPVAQAQNCDRSCLQGMITSYLDAMLKHDPALLAVSSDLRFTQDTQELMLGEGLWQTVEGYGTFRQDVLDVATSTAGVHVVAMEAGVPVLVAIRLKVRNGQIAEVESTVVRSQAEGMIFRPDAIIAASDAMNLRPLPEQRNSRADLIRLALLYPEGLRVGSFVTADAQFAAAAYRFENGQLMAGPGCTFFAGCEHIREQGLPTLAGIKAQVAAVDEEQGIVWLRMNFGAGSVIRADGELSVWEMFKIYDGRIQAVEAFMEIMPPNTPWLW